MSPTGHNNPVTIVQGVPFHLCFYSPPETAIAASEATAPPEPQAGRRFRTILAKLPKRMVGSASSIFGTSNGASTPAMRFSSFSAA